LKKPSPKVHNRKLDIESEVTVKETKSVNSAAIQKKNDELRDEAKHADKEKTIRMKLKKELASKKKYYASLNEDPTGSIESTSDQLNDLAKEAKLNSKKVRNLFDKYEVDIPRRSLSKRKLDVEAQITSKESQNNKPVSNDSSASIKKKNDELRAEAKAADKEKTLRMKLKKELKSKIKYYSSLKEDSTGHVESTTEKLKNESREASLVSKKVRT